MPPRVLLIASIIFFLRLSPVFAAIDIPNFGRIEVVVEGGKRTKQSYIESLVKKCIENSGAFTVAPFVDYGLYDPVVASSGGDYFAYGIGGYYYFNKVNFPGIGIVFGENDSFMDKFVTVQIGALANTGL